MKIFVSYSFRPENEWIERLVIPLIQCFGHTAFTGKIIDGSGSIPDEVKQRMRKCKKVICFATRGQPFAEAVTGNQRFMPPPWVQNEHMLAVGAEQDAIAFVESGVEYGGAGRFQALHYFDKDHLAELLLYLSHLLKEWPVGPLLLRLAVPEEMTQNFRIWVAGGNVSARCRAYDKDFSVVVEEDVPVQVTGDQFVVPFWVRLDPDMTIDIRFDNLTKRLVSKGISPTICIANLQVV